MTMQPPRDLYVAFRLDARTLALPLAAVERVVRMVAMTPMVEAPSWCRGIVNLQGRTVPVIDLRNAFSLAPREPGLGDRLLIATHEGRPVAVIVDEVHGTLEAEAGTVAASAELGFDDEPIQSVVRHRSDLIPVLDLARLFAAALEETSKWLDRS